MVGSTDSVLPVVVNMYRNQSPQRGTRFKRSAVVDTNRKNVADQR